MKCVVVKSYPPELFTLFLELERLLLRILFNFASPSTRLGELSLRDNDCSVTQHIVKRDRKYESDDVLGDLVALVFLTEIFVSTRGGVMLTVFNGMDPATTSGIISFSSKVIESNDDLLSSLLLEFSITDGIIICTCMFTYIRINMMTY